MLPFPLLRGHKRATVFMMPIAPLAEIPDTKPRFTRADLFVHVLGCPHHGFLIGLGLKRQRFTVFR